MAIATKQSAVKANAKPAKKPVERLRPSKKNRVEAVEDTLTLAKIPAGNGGVRFDGTLLKGIYVPQRQWVDAGRPEQFTLVLTPQA